MGRSRRSPHAGEFSVVRNTPTIDEAVECYLQLRKAKFSHDTWVNDRSQLTRLARALNGLQVGSITPERMEHFFYGPGGLVEQMVPASFNKVLSRVDTFFAFCRRRGWIKGDPLGEVQRLPVTRRERLRLSVPELVRLPDKASHPRDRGVLAVACNTALRAGEIADLRLRDVDLDGGWLHVRITKSHLEDQMPITLELDRELRLWLTFYAAHVAAPLGPDAYLFPAKAPGRWRSAAQADPRESVHENGSVYVHGDLRPDLPIRKPAEIVQRALRASGFEIGPGEGLHTIRRSLARAYFERESANGNDVALRATAALLHHSSTQVTEHYLGLNHEKVRRDRSLRGKSFLSALADEANVLPLRKEG
jgi:integrase